MPVLPILLQSGWIQTGNNTPTGADMKIEVDNPYLALDEYMQSFEAAGLGLTTSMPQYGSGEIQKKILQASAWINRYCGRWFDTQTIDEQKYGFTVRPMNPQLLTVVLRNRPYSKINTIYIQVLKWFIQVDVTQTGYLQDSYANGFYKIVPLLSTSGTGIGSPLPAEIVDHVPLGVLWTNYTFGFGKPLTGLGLNQVGATASYQAPFGNELWAPSQPINVYVGGILQPTSAYTVDCPNGIVTFPSVQAGAVTVDITTNESLPAEIKQACALLTSHFIGQASGNPFGLSSITMQTLSMNFGNESLVYKRAKELLEPYTSKMPLILGM